MMKYEIIPEKLVYFAATKCASRTMLGYIFYLQNGFLPNRLSVVNKGVKFTTNNPLKYTYRMCIVRDPIERFISAYCNRVNMNGVNTEYLSISDVIDKVKNGDEEFRKKYFQFFSHIKPLIKHYGTSPKYFTHIFNTNQMGEVKKFIEEQSGRELPDIHLNKSLIQAKPILSESEIDFLKRYYKIDYYIYGKWM